MPRRRPEKNREFPYHINARANNREPFPGDREYIWKTFTGELFLQHVLHKVRVHAFVLMPNHFHLILTSPEKDLGDVMRDFLASSTRIINAKTRRTGHILGGPYFATLIKDPLYYLHAYKYALRNPVKANLCKQVIDYPFSTYHEVLGYRPLRVPVFPPGWSLDAHLPQDLEWVDHWLNRAHRSEEAEAIRRALRKKEFAFSPRASSRRRKHFENDANAKQKGHGD